MMSKCSSYSRKSIDEKYNSTINSTKVQKYFNNSEIRIILDILDKNINICEGDLHENIFPDLINYEMPQ